MRNEKKARKLKDPNWFQKHLPSFHNVSSTVYGGGRLGKIEDSFLGSQVRKWDFGLVKLILYLYACLLPLSQTQIWPLRWTGCNDNPHSRGNSFCTHHGTLPTSQWLGHTHTHLNEDWIRCVCVLYILTWGLCVYPFSFSIALCIWRSTTSS